MEASEITEKRIREAMEGVGEARALNIISITVPDLEDLKRKLEGIAYARIRETRGYSNIAGSR